MCARRSSTEEVIRSTRNPGGAVFSSFELYCCSSKRDCEMTVSRFKIDSTPLFFPSAGHRLFVPRGLYEVRAAVLSILLHQLSLPTLPKFLVLYTLRWSQESGIGIVCRRVYVPEPHTTYTYDSRTG